MVKNKNNKKEDNIDNWEHPRTAYVSAPDHVVQ